MSRLGKFLFFFAFMSLVLFAVVLFLLRAWVPFLWVALAMALGFAIGAFFVEREFFKDFLSMKTTKRGMSMGAMIALVLVLLIAINFIGARKYKTWDFSLAKVNTLSEQSVKILKSLTENLKVIYFYKNGGEGVEQNRHAFVDLIRKYQDQSNFVQLEFDDVNSRPDLTEKYGIKKGTQAVVLEYKDHTSMLDKIDEQELTSGIVKVTREKEKKVFILSGHHELPVEASSDGQSISMVKQLLEGNRYTVGTFSFTTAPEVPADADVLLIAGPQQGFLDFEVRALENFLKRGGGIILAVKPKAPTNLDKFLAGLGVKLGGNYIATVLDTPVGRAVDPRFTRGSVFDPNDKIVSPFGHSEFTVFHLPQSIKVEKAPEGVKIDEFVKTNESGMAFSDLAFKSEGQKGPFTLGVEVTGTYPGVEDKSKTFDLLVFGDSEFLDDQYLYQNLNRDLLLNSVAALSKEENLISISPKEIGATKFEMPDTKFLLFIFAFVIPLPLLIFAASGVLWFRRRYA